MALHFLILYVDPLPVSTVSEDSPGRSVLLYDCRRADRAEPPMLLSPGDISDTPTVLDPVGGGFEAVPSCHLDGRGPQVTGPQLYRARKPHPGQNK